MKRATTGWLLGLWLLVAASVHAVELGPAPSISVTATDGMFTRHAAAIGSGIFMNVLLAEQGTNLVATFDVYVGVILPDGRFASWVGDPEAPSVAIGPSPLPFLVNVAPTATTAFEIAHTFSAADPQGWWLLYGIVVLTGAQVADPRTWISTSFFPLLLYSGFSPVAQP